MDLEIGLLGELRVRLGDSDLTLGGQRQRCLLAVLLLNRGRTLAPAELAELAWPSDPPGTVFQQIANILSALRRVLGPAGQQVRLLARRPGYVAEFEPGLLDAERFSALLGLARAARAARDHEVAADHLRRAMNCWRGAPLNGLDTPYLRQRARALVRERQAALLLLGEIESEAGRPEQAVTVLRGLLEEQPDHEAAAAALVRALTECGVGGEAVETARRTAEVLRVQGRVAGRALREAHSDALAGRTPRGLNRPDGLRRQLPAVTPAIAGRERELAELLAPGLALRASAGDDRDQDGEDGRVDPDTGSAAESAAAVICAINGMAGVGKTTLAVHAAQNAAPRFPDGQLYVDLHGHTQGMDPLDPAAALATLLQAYGVAPQSIPPGWEMRAALFRGFLAGTRTLLVLDDAADEAQVRPLLPGTGGCLVIVTSRRRLKGLDDTMTLALDVLPSADAVALFRERAGLGRTDPNDPLLAVVVALCGQLPLALRMAAALLRHRPAWRLSDLVARLERGAQSLDDFSDGEHSLQAVFDLSFAMLGAAQQRLFRRLGLMPGPDIDLSAAAALVHEDPARAETDLEALVDHNMLTEPSPGRYRLHSLLRVYARAQALREASDETDRAIDRLFAQRGRATTAAD